MIFCHTIFIFLQTGRVQEVLFKRQTGTVHGGGGSRGCGKVHSDGPSITAVRAGNQGSNAQV